MELNTYDTAVSSYKNSSKISQVPLLSWDFHGKFFQELSENMADVRALELLSQQNEWLFDIDLKNELDKETVIVVTNPQLQIVFSSHNMIKMNGYTQEEVIGKSPKIFQGEATSKKISSEISEAIRLQQPFEKNIINYRKNGALYRCHIKGFPIFNKKGVLSHFIALEKAA